ncbi:hypothetical protein [uncultured Shewanella sp.]|uniref:hypothetical protein n=1 Tax=uncultured Shewanella sp. TaxID=173975 RepID=UPI0026312402|nr:hypothetical protein [uncultured Shewanella sp.]
MSETGSEKANQSADKPEGKTQEAHDTVLQKSGAFSGVSGHFKSGCEDNVRGDQWAFNFNKAKNEVDLTVTLNSPSMLMEMGHQYLDTTLSLDDVNQLIRWLFQVKTTVKQAMNKASIKHETTKGGDQTEAPALSAPAKS